MIFYKMNNYYNINGLNFEFFFSNYLSFYTTNIVVTLFAYLVKTFIINKHFNDVFTVRYLLQRPNTK